MQSRAGYLYLAAAAAFAVAFGIGVGAYWVDDALLLALASCAVVAYCFQKVGGAPSSGQEERHYVPRSRIAHYVLVSRIKSGFSGAKESGGQFERLLLSRQDWQALSAEELKEISGRRRDQSEGPR